MKNVKLEGLRKILYVCLPLLVYVILYDVCNTFLMYLGLDKALCIMGGLLLTFLCMLKMALTDGFLRTKKEIWKKTVWQYLIFLPGSVILAYVCNYIVYAFGFLEKSESYRVVAQNQYSVTLWAGFLLYGMVSPFVEEVIFRGFLYGRMRIYIKKGWAVILSSLLFGIYHGNFVQGVYGFLMGIFLTIAYEYSQNFYLAFLMHMLANLTGYYTHLIGWI